MGRIIWSPAGLTLLAREREWLASKASAGIILFTENYAARVQLKELTAEVRKISPHAVIAVDQEGGRVQRFRHEFTSLPAFGRLGELYAQDADKAIITAGEMGRLVAVELRACGINMNNAPVLDVDRGISQVIGDRSWAGSPEQVILLAAAYAEGLKKGGVLAVGKHFPGHGGVVTDSHEGLPCDSRAVEDIQEDMKPFIELARQLPCLMTAHIVYERFDKSPATFSSFWLQKQLRTRLGYTGVVISDDLCMGAVQALYPKTEEAVVTALRAGCDLLLVCRNAHKIEEALHCVARLNEPNLPEARQAQLRLPVPVKDDFDEERARADLNALTLR